MFKDLLKLLKQSTVYGIGAVATPIISFIMLPLYTHYLTVDDYGVFNLVQITKLVMIAVVGMGISSGIVRIYFVYDTKEERDAVITSSLIFLVLIGTPIVAILYFFSAPISHMLFDVEKGEIYFNLILFTLIFGLTGTCLMAALRAEEKAKSYTAVSVITLVITLSLNILFIVGFERGVQGILEAFLISSIISIFLMTPFVLKGKKITFSFSKVKEVLGFGGPLIPASLAGIVLTSADRYFLDAYMSKTEVGLYSLSYRIASIISIIIIQPFSIAWAPYMFSLLNQDNAKDIFRKVLVYYSFFAVWVGLFLSVFALEGLMILATPEYYIAYQVVPLIVISYILTGMDTILMAGIHIKKKTIYVSAFFLSAATVNLSLNYLLIPKMGMWGAAIATILSYMFMNFLYFRKSQKLYYIQHEFKRIISVFIIGASLYMVSLLIPSDSGLILTISLKAVICLIFPAILFVIKFYRAEELNKISEIVKQLLARNK